MLTRTKVEKVIGKTFADKLDEVIFESGNWHYTRRQMVDSIGCGSFNSCVRLSKVLKKLGITAPSQLYKLDPASLIRVRGIGESSLFTAMCILEAEGYDVLSWWSYDKDKSVKFGAFKRNVIKRASKNKQEVA